VLLTVFGAPSLAHRPQLRSTHALRGEGEGAAQRAAQRPTTERAVGDLLRSGLFVCISRILNIMPTCLAHAYLDPGLPALRVGRVGAGGGGGGRVVHGGGGGELPEDLLAFLLDYISGLGTDAAAEHRDERQGGGDREQGLRMSARRRVKSCIRTVFRNRSVSARPCLQSTISLLPCCSPPRGRCQPPQALLSVLGSRCFCACARSTVPWRSVCASRNAVALAALARRICCCLPSRKGVLVMLGPSLNIAEGWQNLGCCWRYFKPSLVYFIEK